MKPIFRASGLHLFSVSVIKESNATYRRKKGFIYLGHNLRLQSVTAGSHEGGSLRTWYTLHPWSRSEIYELVQVDELHICPILTQFRSPT